MVETLYNPEVSPYHLLKEIATAEGALVYTEEFGEQIARRTLQNARPFLLNKYTGTYKIFNLIAEILGVNINAQTGRFTKGNPQDDKSLWTFTPQNNFIPTGMEITILIPTGITIGTPELQYLNKVIPLYLPYWITDIRISTSTAIEKTIYYASFLTSTIHYRITTS